MRVINVLLPKAEMSRYLMGREERGSPPMHATNYTQPTRSAENRTMTSTFMGTSRRSLVRVVLALLGSALLIAVPASLEAQQKVLVLDKSSVKVFEGSGAATVTYNVRLSTEPTETVTVTVTVEGKDSMAVTVDTDTSTDGNQSTRTFGPGDWSNKEVTVTRSDDDAVDNPGGGRFPIIKHTPKGGGFSKSKTLQVVVVNDDEAGLSLATDPPTDPPTTPTTVTVTEKGKFDDSSVIRSTRAFYTVKLDSEPTGTVTVSVASSDIKAATVSPLSLTFTATNYSTPQTVTVTGVDDKRDNINDRRERHITHMASGGGYDSITDKVNVVVLDSGTTTVSGDDVPGLKFDRAMVTVAEAGGVDYYTVWLSTQPREGSVTVTVESGDTRAATVSPATLTFTAADYSTSQTVTVTGVDDKKQPRRPPNVVHHPQG